MERQDIRKIALECGFKLDFQPDGNVDLDPRVYEFASKLLVNAVEWQEANNLPRVIELSTAMSLIYTSGCGTDTMDIVRALDILRSVRDDLASLQKPQLCPIPYLPIVEQNLPHSAELHTQEDDPVNHPSHYTSHPSGVEAIEITRHMSFNLGNAMKYLWRNGLKDGQPAVQDLEKAVWYIQDEIKKLKALEAKNP